MTLTFEPHDAVVVLEDCAMRDAVVRNQAGPRLGFEPASLRGTRVRSNLNIHQLIYVNHGNLCGWTGYPANVLDRIYEGKKF